MKRFISRASAILLTLIVAITAASAAEIATGVVFHDVDRDGIRGPGEPGIENVRVSNGRTVTVTDAEGRYRLPIDDAIIFVIKPRGWMPLVDASNVPRFYYIHKPKGSPELRFKGVAPTGPLPESVDFPLYPNEEPDRFTALILGDTQPARQEQVHYLNHDVITELVGAEAAFGVILGDIVGDNLSLYDTLVPAVGLIGIPFYYVKGNHDSNYDGAPDQNLVDETFERVFGPAHYSFDYGPVHFVVLNNAYFVRPNGYEARLDLRQMAFLRNDLRLVPREQPVVLLMHIPLTEMKDRHEIYELLAERPFTLSFSAHTHTQEHRFIGSEDGWKGNKPHHHVVNVTACGSWWGGWPDELELPHATMSDGTPNGYSIVTFDGSSYRIRFKAARRPADYQMNIYAPDSVTASESAGTAVYVNVFGGSEKSRVEMRFGNSSEWVPMKRVDEKDPQYERLKQIEGNWKAEGYRALPNPNVCKHLWRAELPADPPRGAHLIHIRETDMFGQVNTGRRVIYIK